MSQRWALYYGIGVMPDLTLEEFGSGHWPGWGNGTGCAQSLNERDDGNGVGQGTCRYENTGPSETPPSKDTCYCARCGVTIDLICHCGDGLSAHSDHMFIPYYTCNCEFLFGGQK